MEDMDLNRISEQGNSEMEQIEFDLEQSSPNMDQIEFKLDNVDTVKVVDYPEENMMPLDADTEPMPEFSETEESSLELQADDLVVEETAAETVEVCAVVEENPAESVDVATEVVEANSVQEPSEPTAELEDIDSAPEMSAEELGVFVTELETSMSELGDFVDKMNQIVNDEDSGADDDSEDVSTKNRSQGVQRTVLSYMHDIAFGMVAILLLFMIVFRVVVVSGPSMQQTLQHGDCLVLLNSVFYRNPKVGDIVVATKSSYKDGEPIIKRVIATEGQTVDIDFEKGIVYVDGVALDEPYTNSPTNLYEGVSFPLTVNENCVFVMGDNRNDSKDSRSVEIGQIDRRELLGKALFLVIPGVTGGVGEREFDRIGALW